MQSRQEPQAIVVLDGPGAGSFPQKMAISQGPCDRGFRERVSEFHGIDFSRPDILSPAELFMDWQARRYTFAEITE